MGGRWVGIAPAKVNLFLRILSREEGGFHQVETLFQALDLGDRIEVEVRPRAGDSRVDLGVTGAVSHLGPPTSNLTVRAARRFLDAAGLEKGVSVRIRLEKRIPVGGGLGGGSSDAATVLQALAALFPEAVPGDRLVREAGSLGADVPFFLTGAPLALAWGRGDQMAALPPLPSRPILLLIPPSGISTPWAYGTLAAHRKAQGVGPAPARILPAALFQSGAEGRWAVVDRLSENAFEAPLAPRHPELLELKRALVEAGAGLALLSGSGSTVFGGFASDSELEKAADELAQRYPQVRQIRTATRVEPSGGSSLRLEGFPARG
jgi:4-diphosphocytidyl-2-C-methyl-D-erythritol kinase